MQTRPEHQHSSGIPITGKTTNELIKLVRKLRWIGMEEEAAELEMELEHRHTTQADSVIATPAETD